MSNNPLIRVPTFVNGIAAYNPPVPTLFRRAIGAAVLGVLGCAAPVRAVDIHQVLTGYTTASWRSADGSLLNGIRSIVQDGDGYLWLGTGVGLMRFDGLRFSFFVD